MKSLEELDPRPIRAILTDLDDTLTDHSRIGSGTFESLWRLKERGYRIAIVSGRPAGWADCLIRLWPIDAMIFENGAGLVYREDKIVRRVRIASESERAESESAMKAAFAAVQREVPKAKLASDQKYRAFDYAIDFAEEPPYLSTQEVELILNILRNEKGITAKSSSIHINFWRGAHTKVDACMRLLADHWRLTPEQTVYCGDSPNDEPMFEHFPISIGVANVLDFSKKMSHLPKYLTRSRGGSGFQEIVHRLLTHA